jgi:hypothetical protein
LIVFAISNGTFPLHYSTKATQNNIIISFLIKTMFRFAPRVATRAVASSSAAFQSSHVATGAAATQALTARWMSAAAPGPKVRLFFHLNI